MPQAIAAAVAVMASLPLAFVLLLTLPAPEGVGLGGGLAERANQAGPWSYLINLSGLVAAILSAVAMGFATRRPNVPAPLALAPWILPWLTAAVAARSAMRDFMSLLPSADAADVGRIIVGAASEMDQLRVFAFAWSAAGALAVGLACGVSLVAPVRGPRVVTALGALALGTSSWTALRQVAMFISHRQLAVYADSPAPLEERVLAASAEYARDGRLPVVGLLAAVAVALGGGGVIWRREGRRLAAATALSLCAAALGVRGVAAFTERVILTGVKPTTNQPRVHP